jgi:hypothetical protein
MGMRAVLKDVKALPCSESESSRNKRDRQARLRERRADVRCHIVRAFSPMTKVLVILGNQPLEKIAQIERNVGIGILLYNQRARRMLNEHSEQAVFGFLLGQPFLHVACERIKSLAAS